MRNLAGKDSARTCRQWDRPAGCTALVLCALAAVPAFGQESLITAATRQEPISSDPRPTLREPVQLELRFSRAFPEQSEGGDGLTTQAVEAQGYSESGLVQERIREMAEQALAKLSAENGIDPTAVIGRFQLENDYLDQVKGRWQNDTVLRVDVPLRPNVILRVDTPFRDRNLPNGSTVAGLGDLLVRIGSRVYETPAMRFFVGADAIFPTASNDQLGTGKYQVGPGVAVSISIPEIKSVLIPLVQHFVDVGGDPRRANIDDTRVRVQLNTIWSEKWYTLVESILDVDWTQHAKTGMTLTAEVGRQLDNHWRVYVEPGGGLWGREAPAGYEWKATVGVRYMFYVF